MATIKSYNFNKLQDAWETDPAKLTLRQQSQAQSIDFDNQQNTQNPSDFTKVDGGGNAFKAIAEANKNVDQSALVEGKKKELQSGINNLSTSINNQYDGFKDANKFSTSVNAENLINGQEADIANWQKLQQANSNTFKDSVNEGAFDETIKNLNQNSEQFLDQSATQGNRALDAYLLNQSGALTKTRNDLINQTVGAKQQVENLRKQSSGVVDNYEASRKNTLDSVKEQLKQKQGEIDKRAEAQGADYYKSQSNAARQAALQKLAVERDSEIAKWQGALDSYSKLKADDTAPVRMDSYITGAQNKLNELRNQDLGALIKNIEGGGGGSHYNQADADRFNKITSILGLGGNRQVTVTPEMRAIVESNLGRFGRPEEFKAIPKVLPNEGPSTQDRMATTIKEQVKNNPLINPVATVKKANESPLINPVAAVKEVAKEAKKDSTAEKVTTVLTGGGNKFKKLFGRK